MTKKVDDNGWWIIKDNPLSKVGIYPYLGKQIDDSLEPNKIYRVFRPAEELLNEETVKSFNLVPLVNDHEMLGKDFKPAEEKGIDGIIYNPRVAHGDMLMGNIKIYSEKMMRDIKNGKKELSMGYTCTYDLTPGDWDGQHYDVVQRNLRGNHVALVDKGRMGSDVRVYDKHICCDSMDITGNIKRVRAEDITHDTWRLRKDTGLNYVTQRKESTINRLIKESGLPIARKTEATKLFGMPNYRNRFDAKFKEDEAWLNAQKVRFKQTRKKVGWRKLLEMPSFQRYKAKEEELRDILARRDAIEKEVYGDRAGLDTAWIKVPGEERNEPNIMDKVVTKSAEAAAIMALLSAVLKMNKEKKTAKDSINGVNNMDVMKRKQALDNALNKKLYKIGVAYGKKLAKVYGKKTAQDMATSAALNILSLNKKAAKDGKITSWITVRGKHIPLEAGKTVKESISNAFNKMKKWSNKTGAPAAKSAAKTTAKVGAGLLGARYLVDPDMRDFVNEGIGEGFENVTNKELDLLGKAWNGTKKSLAWTKNNLPNSSNIGNFKNGIAYANKEPILRAPGQNNYFDMGKKFGDTTNKIKGQISGAAQKAVEFGGTHASNFGKSISNLVSNVSPKAAELFNKYPKTTGLAAAAAITAALAGAGYGAYKLYKNHSGKNKRSK